MAQPSRSQKPGDRWREHVTRLAMQSTLEATFHGSELTALLGALVAMKKGKWGVRLPLEWTGVAGKVADAFNDVVELNEHMASELPRLSRVVGKEGKLGQRAALRDVTG